MQRIFTKLRKPLIFGAAGIGTLYCFDKFIGKFFGVEGDNSMFPTIQDGDWLWASRIRNLDKLKKGDIVALVDPDPDDPDDWDYLCRRITAIRKEQMEVEVHGDNPEAEDSCDSRHFGPVNLANCHFKFQYRVYPWERIGWIK